MPESGSTAAVCGGCGGSWPCGPSQHGDERHYQAEDFRDRFERQLVNAIKEIHMLDTYERHGFLHGEPVVFKNPAYVIPYYGIVDLTIPCTAPYVPVRFVSQALGSGGYAPVDLDHLLPAVLRPNYQEQRQEQRPDA